MKSTIPAAGRGCQGRRFRPSRTPPGPPGPGWPVATPLVLWLVPQFDEEAAPVPPAPDDFEPAQSPTEEEKKDAAHDDHEGPD